MNVLRPAWLSVATLCFCVTTFAHAADFISECKRAWNFAAWPNKTGPLKAGVVFNPQAHPALSGWSLLNEEYDTSHSDQGLAHSYVFQQGNGILNIRIMVAITSPAVAQEMLMTIGIGESQQAWYDVFNRGDTHGLAIGDLNIVPTPERPTSSGGFIAFARNNIGFSVRISGVGATCDVLQLAREVDADIVAAPVVTPAAFTAARPVVTTFKPAKGTIAAGETTPLTIAISDPRNLALKAIVTSVRDAHIDSTANPMTVRGSELGVIPLTLFAIDAALLFSTATSSITVTP